MSLKLVNAVVEKVRTGARPEDTAAFARALRDTADLCGSGYMCYYRGDA